MRGFLVALLVLGLGAAAYMLFGTEEDPSTQLDDLAGGGDATEERTADLVGRGGTIVEEGEALDAPGPEGRYIVRGSVLDAKGKPVEGIEVLAYFQSPSWQDHTRASIAWRGRAATITRLSKALKDPFPELRRGVTLGVTDGDGSFALDVRRTGSFKILARPEAPSVASYSWVQVTRHQPTPHTTLHVGPGVAMNGIVVTADGTPVQATLRATRIAAPAEAFSRAWESEPVTTAEDGTFTFAAAPEGELMFDVIRVPLSRETGLMTDHEAGKLVKVVVSGGTALLEGRVLGEGDAPIAGAGVQASVMAENGATLTSVARTSADGSWRLEGLPPGDVTSLKALAPGYVAFDQGPPSAPWSPLALANNEGRTVTIRLLRGGTLRGRVTDLESGAPLEGAQVHIQAFATPVGERNVPGLGATTDKDGSYVIEGVAEGGYTIRVSHATHYHPEILQAAKPLGEEGASNAPAAAPPAPGFMPPGSRRSRFGSAELTFVMDAQGGELRRDLGLRLGATVSGTVQGPEGPVSGAMIRVMAGLGNNRVNQGRFRSDPVVSDEEGRFTYGGLPPGAGYVFAASKSELVGERSEPTDVGGKDAVDALVLKLITGAVVRGRVVDEAGDPVPGKMLWFWNQSGRNTWVTSGNTSATSGADGTFELKGLAPGTYNHMVQSAGMMQTALAGPKDLEPGEVREGLEVVLKGGPAKSEGDYKVRLLDKEGKPLRHKQILVAVKSGGSHMQTIAQSNGRGVAKVENYNAEGTVDLQIQAGGPSWTSVAKDLELEDGVIKDVEVEIPEPKRITGLVLDPAGDPVPLFRAGLQTKGMGPRAMEAAMLADASGEIIQYSSGRGMNMSTQGVNGRFVLQVQGDGPWTIVVSGARDRAGRPVGLAKLERKIETVSDQPITFQLAKGETIEGRVTDSRGRPVAGVQLSTDQAEDVTDKDGVFAIGGAEGKTQLRIVVPKGFVQKPAMQVEPGKRLDIELIEGLAIRGKVIKPDGSPGANAHLHASWQKGEGFSHGSRSMQTSTDGTFELDGLPPGAKVHLRVHIWNMGGGVAPWEKKDIAPGTRDLEIRLRSGAKVEGRILTADGKPAGPGWINLNAKGGGQGGWGQLAADGTFTIDNVEAGTYTLNVTLHGAGGRGTFPDIKAPASGLELTMPRTSTLKGRVDDESGGWRVMARSAKNAEGHVETRHARPGKDGTFTMSIPEGRGPWTLTATHNSVGRYGVLDGVDEGGEGLLIRTEEGRTIQGRVEDADGKPVPRARVRANPSGSGALPVSGGGQTDDEGRFTIKGLAPGEYSVTVWVRGSGQRSPEPVKAQAGDANVVLRTRPVENGNR